MKRKRLRRFLILDFVLLLLLVATVLLTHVGNNTEGDVDDAADIVMGEVSENAEEQEENVADDVTEKSEKLYAYRGNSGEALYSMASYDNAADAGAGIIVLPFVVSQDGTLYVADDDYAQELTGYGGYFSGMTDGQIDNLSTTSGDKVLRLSDVFDKYGRDLHYVIELKYTSERNLMALKEMIEKYDYADNVSISSSYFSGLRSLDNEFPNIPKIFLCSAEDEWAEALGLEYIDEISVSKDMMNEERCNEAHEKSKKFGVYTLDTEEEIKSAINLGVDSYFTNEAVLASGLEKAE